MEIAGLTLGAVALVGPTYRLYKDCGTLILNIRNYSRDLKKCCEKLSHQQRTYANECELILCLLVEKNIATSMLEDSNHVQWNDTEFKQRWSSTMGKHFDIPLNTAHGSLIQIEAKLAKLQGKIAADQNSTPASQSSGLSRTQRIKSLSWKADWAISGKEDLNRLIETLRKQNMDLAHTRKQRTASSKNDTKPATNVKAKFTDPDLMLTRLLSMREVSKTLYESLADTAGCCCHRVNLQLQGCLEDSMGISISTSLSSPAKDDCIKFRLVVIKDTEGGNDDSKSNEHCDCTCIVVNSEKICPAELSQLQARSKRRISTGGISGKVTKRVRFAAVENDSDVIGSSPTRATITISEEDQNGGKRVMDIDLGPGKKKLKLTLDTDDETSNCNPGSDPIPSLLKITSPTLVEIDDLCSLLKKLQPEETEDKLIGRISNKGRITNHQHTIYRDLPGSYRKARTSLEQLLERDDKQHILPRIERLQIALTLSVSLLRFGSYSTSWFHERWRSRDIFFFLDLQRALPAAYSGSNTGMMDPYVVPAFQRGLQDTLSPTDKPQFTHIVRNQQLFSLAVVLIEVAFGDKLFRIYEPKRIAEKNGDPVAEYMKAKMILDHGMLAREMGPDYDQIVKACLFCDFGIGEADLSKRELQETYYRKVVAPLERCLKVFKGETVT